MSETTIAEHGAPTSVGREFVLSGLSMQALAAGHPLWRIDEGAVELFVSHAGGRTFIGSMEQGAFVFNLPAGGELLICGAAGTTLREVQPESIDMATLATAADRWLTGLATCFVGTRQGQEPLVTVQADDRIKADPGTVMQASKSPVWAVLPGVGRAKLVGTEITVDGPATVPLIGSLRFVALEASNIWMESSASIGDQDACVQRVVGFNGHLPTAFHQLADMRATATMARLKSARSESDRQVQSSLEALDRSTMAASRTEIHSSSLGPTGLALARALDALGAPVDVSRLAGTSADLADVPALARRVGVRTRRVLLRPGWHRQDLGVLVSSQGDTRSPVALVPNRRGRYDVAAGQSTRLWGVGEREAATIGPTAYSLYRPLDEKRQRIGDLVTFVWRDIRSDGLTAAWSGAAIGLLGTLAPIMTAVIVDSVIPSNEVPLLVQLGVALALVALLSFGFTVSREVALHRIDGRTSAALQAALWDRLLRLPASFFRSYSAGDLAQRLAGIESVRNAIVDVAMGASIALAFSSFNVVLLFVFAPSVAVLAVLLVVILAAITVGVGWLQVRYGRKIAQIDGELSGLVIQYLQGVTKLRIAGAESRAFARWADRYAQERAARVKAGRTRNHFEAFSGAYEIITLAVLFWAMTWLAADQLSVGRFIAFLAAFGAFQTAFLGFARSAITAFSVMPQYERSKPILETPLETDTNKSDPGELKGGIQVNGLVFAYPGSGALFNGLDLTVEPGQRVALVGKSGSGKSTLIRLLLGFEKPSAGAILYDGQNLDSLDLSLLRRQIGVVLQTGRVFAGSILDNIRGSNDLSLEACTEAAHAAGLQEDLTLLPMGLHTPLTEGAATLSGGQRQRILIARALAARPKLLFLDEATSALDNRTQKIVTETLDRTGATSVIVAHRLSTVRSADKIFVIHDGQVSEQGTFDELMALNGTFAELASRQLL